MKRVLIIALVSTSVVFSEGMSTVEIVELDVTNMIEKNNVVKAKVSNNCQEHSQDEVTIDDVGGIEVGQQVGVGQLVMQE